MSIAELRRLIADDAYAITFQTFGQYRTALLKACDAASASSPASPGAPTDLSETWRMAYAAFKGAFDTPLARHRDDSEFARDARARLRDFDERLAASPGAVSGEPTESLGVPASPPGPTLQPPSGASASIPNAVDGPIVAMTINNDAQARAHLASELLAILGRTQ